MMILARVEVEFHWGFWIRQPLASARQESYVIPQPSTLIGAFANALSKALYAYCNYESSETYCKGESCEVPLAIDVIKFVEEVYFRVLEGYGLSRVDLTRHFQAPYIRSANLQRLYDALSQGFAVREVGKVYSPLLKAEIAYLINGDKFREFLKGKCANIDEFKLLKACLISISRIGPVEGIVNPVKIDVREVKAEKIDRLRIAGFESPCPYFRAKIENLPPNWSTMYFWNWRKGEFWTSLRKPDDTLPYVVPLREFDVLSGVIKKFGPCSTLSGVIGELKGYVVDDAFYPSPLY